MSTTTIKQTLKRATQRLAAKHIATAALDAELLLAYTLDKSKEFLHTHPEQPLSPAQRASFTALLTRRAKHEPVAYLTKQKDFYGLTFYVDKRVLVPRPETELLVDAVLRLAHKKSTIADIGTGSGCIAVAVKHHLPNATVYATDRFAAALTVAKKNAKHHGTAITFFRGDLLKPLVKKSLDIVVANLPYLDTGYKNLLPNSATASLRFEPRQALFAGPQGLDSYRNFFTQLKQRKQQPRYIICEIGHPQAAGMRKLLSFYQNPGDTIRIEKDYADFNRVVIIKRARH